MKTVRGILFVLSLLPIGSLANAQTVFFEEQFNGPILDPSIWRTEILTAGPRWCADNSGPWAPGVWIDEGEDCHGTSVHSPYGTASLAGGVLSMGAGNPRAFPFLASRLPGSVVLFPPTGDFSVTVRLRYDHVTGYGTGLVVCQTDNTEPVGHNAVAEQNIILQVWDDQPGGGIPVRTSLDGTWRIVGYVPSPFEFHDFVVRCTGTSYTISVDGELIFGPVTSGLRPTAIEMGNNSVAFWGDTDWCTFSVDYIQVEVPGVPVGACCFSNDACLQGTQADCQSLGGNYVGDGVPCDPNPCGATPVSKATWGRVKALYR